MTGGGRGYAPAMARRIREEIIEDVPVAHRVVTTERRVGPSYGANPLALVIAGLLLVFILVMVFGYLV